MTEQRIKTILRQAVLIATGLLFCLSPADAAGEQVGLGLIVGEPTGLSAKYQIDRVNAIDLAVAWNLSGDNDFTLHADYLWHNYELVKFGSGETALYFGLGGRMELRDNKSDRFGVRIPIGLSYRFTEPEFLELFGEVAPILDLAPSTRFDMNVGIGARVYFF